MEDVIQYKKEFDNEEINKFYNIMKTTWQMLDDRGYIVFQKELDIDLETFAKNYRGPELNILTQRKSNPDEYIYVEYSNSSKIGVKELTEFGEKLRSKQVRHGIMIISGSLSNAAKQAIIDLEEDNFHLEYFEEKQLLVNITHHELVPKHVTLTEDEKRVLIEKYKLKDIQLPKILVSDPVARYLGCRKGQVIKIVRSSETAGRYVTYRYVS